MPIVSIFSGASMTTPDIHAVLLSYVRDGVLRDPAVMGLRSFAREELEARGFDACGNPAQICLYEEQRRFRRAGRAVQLACKVFLAQGRWCANGLELGYQVRLAGVLRAVGKPAMPAFRVLLHVANEQRMLAALTTREQTQLGQLLDKLLRGLMQAKA